MSYYPKKGMHRDKHGIAVFDQQPRWDWPQAKRWFRAEVVRVVLDGRGEVVRRNKQAAAVYAVEEEAAGLALRQCPDPWPGQTPTPQLQVAFWPISAGEEL